MNVHKNSRLSCRPIRAFSATPHDGQRPCRTLAEDPGRTQSRAVPPNPAAQTRIVSVARIRLGPRISVRPFKGIFCDDISEFESYMPSHAVRSLWRFAEAVLRGRVHIERSLKIRSQERAFARAHQDDVADTRPRIFSRACVRDSSVRAAAAVQRPCSKAHGIRDRTRRRWVRPLSLARAAPASIPLALPNQPDMVGNSVRLPRTGGGGVLKFGVFDPDAVRTLVAAFDAAWQSIKASGANLSDMKPNSRGRHSQSTSFSRPGRASVTRAVCATAPCFTWLSQI
jgi:hypothetical protein